MRWRVYLANLDPIRGSKQRGTRSVAVVSYEGFNGGSIEEALRVPLDLP